MWYLQGQLRYSCHPRESVILFLLNKPLQTRHNNNIIIHRMFRIYNVWNTYIKFLDTPLVNYIYIIRNIHLYRLTLTYTDVYTRGNNSYNEMRLYVVLYLIYNILGFRVVIRTLVVADERRWMVKTCKTMLFQRFQYYITRVNSKRQDNIKALIIRYSN